MMRVRSRDLFVAVAGGVCILLIATSVRKAVVLSGKPNAKFVACVPPADSQIGDAIVEECPATQDFIAAARNAGEESWESPYEARKVKVLFFTSFYFYTSMMSRWYYHMHEAARSLPGWDTYLWGPGFPYYRKQCRCVPWEDSFFRRAIDTFRGASGERVVDCMIPGDEGLSKPESMEMDPSVPHVDEAWIPQPLRPSDAWGCKSLRALSFAEQTAQLFETDQEPFDIIFINWPVGPRSRSQFFRGLSSHTKIVLFEHEWHGWTLKQVEATQPDLIFHPYVDNFEENFAVRLFAKNLQPFDRRRKVFLPPAFGGNIHRKLEGNDTNLANGVGAPSDGELRDGNRRDAPAMPPSTTPTSSTENSLEKRWPHAGANLILNEYTRYGPDVLVGFAPLGVLPNCHSAWKEAIFGDDDEPFSARRQVREGTGAGVSNLQSGSNKTILIQSILNSPEARPIDIFFVGLTDLKHYPSRAVLSEVMKKNFGGLADNIVQLQHPGYTEIRGGSGVANCTSRLEQRSVDYLDYVALMEKSKICFVGDISTWSIRKYKEAMAAGCLVVGDVPGDSHLAEFIVDLNVTLPGTWNGAEDLDRDAVEKAIGVRPPPSRNDTLEDHPISLPEPYSQLKVRTTMRTAARQLAAALKKTLADYLDGKYDDFVREAQAAALRDYSWQTTLTRWILPAVDAHSNGERGWFRMPRYFREYGRKYSVRHRYLLAEWLLVKRGLGIRAVNKNRLLLERRQETARNYMTLPYEELLESAENLLVAENKKECKKTRDRYNGKCVRESMLYFPRMSDFDLKFIEKRALYSQPYPLDGFSHRNGYHVPSLYVG